MLPNFHSDVNFERLRATISETVELPKVGHYDQPDQSA